MNTKTMTDEQLTIALQNGNTQAMGELYSRYYLVVFNKCLSFTKNADDASDLAQDVMIRVFDKIKGFKGSAKFSTWLYAITFNFCTDRQRKAKGKKFSGLDTQYELEDQADILLAEAIERSNKETIAMDALQHLDMEEREMLLMKYQHNKSIQELTAIFQLSPSAVKMRLLRARTKAVGVYETLQNNIAA